MSNLDLVVFVCSFLLIAFGLETMVEGLGTVFIGVCGLLAVLKGTTDAD